MTPAPMMIASTCLAIEANISVFRPVVDERPKPAVAVPGELLADRAYAELRDRIVTLAIAPGAPINEDALGRELEMGRTPVREAIKRLALERLVTVYPRRPCRTRRRQSSSAETRSARSSDSSRSVTGSVTSSGSRTRSGQPVASRTSSTSTPGCRATSSSSPSSADGRRMPRSVMTAEPGAPLVAASNSRPTRGDEVDLAHERARRVAQQDDHASRRAGDLRGAAGAGQAHLGLS